MQDRTPSLSFMGSEKYPPGGSKVSRGEVGQLKTWGNSGNSGNTSRKPKRGAAFRGSMLFPLSVHLVGTVGTLPALRPLPCADWRGTLTPRLLLIVQASASIPLDGPAPVHASWPRRLNSDGRVWKPE